MVREWFANWYRNKMHRTGPFATREEAIAAAFRKWPKAKEVSSGYGYHGTFDIQWTKRETWEKK